MRESEGTKHASLRAESGGPLINERRYGRAGAGTENRPLSHVQGKTVALPSCLHSLVLLYPFVLYSEKG